MQNNKINVSELDFDLIKSNLKGFLKGQDKFTDYDFEGSSLSILLDLLAYNTHYGALYNNLAVNESFLDSASKRNSVVSLAKALGYVPSSARGAVATITLIVSNTTTNQDILNLPKYTQFSTTVDGQNYIFYTTQDHVASRNTNNNTYTFPEINIKEGFPLTFKYQVIKDQKYILPNADVDLSTLTVRVQETATSSLFETWNRNEDLLNIDSESKVFFVKEIENEFYELEFGNGVIGKALNNGNIVNIEYMTCNKDLPNGARSFTFQGANLFGGTISNPITIIAAEGGVDKEDIETIRFNAPRAYSAQNRAVSINDYKNSVKSYISGSDSTSGSVSSGSCISFDSSASGLEVRTSGAGANPSFTIINCFAIIRAIPFGLEFIHTKIIEHNYYNRVIKFIISAIIIIIVIITQSVRDFTDGDM